MLSAINNATGITRGQTRAARTANLARAARGRAALTG
jgi:hypothetical protein